ncbi:MAG: hypothetical protein AVDCRST_MAG96-1183 [uncultured Segetibacter sp.]|uniref:Uncharacterized protein n=1 Tax=uncultured Segetibacter sp. TaxID=481133 RepID=A0A6J4S771_9BACT|nr:MAG: hypothetical protein AVDCRST_MAG96-1183 [uncultured Segetibacter sp.]
MTDPTNKSEDMLKKLSRRNWLRNAAIAATSAVALPSLLTGCTKEQWNHLKNTPYPGGGVGGAQDYGVMKCTNIVTNEFRGYLGTYGFEYADIVSDISAAEKFRWYIYESDLYLERYTYPNNRYLGLYRSEGVDYADYGLWTITGWVNAVLYNSDKSISLKADPRRKLYKYDDNYLAWTTGESNQNILALELDRS